MYNANATHEDVVEAVVDCFTPSELAGIYVPGSGGEDGVLVLVDGALAPSCRRRLTRDLRDRIESLSDQKIPVRVGCDGVIDPDEWSRTLRCSSSGAVRID
jgi:hypothetical protein